MDNSITNAFVSAIGAKPKTTYTITANGADPAQFEEVSSASLEIAIARVEDYSKYPDVIRAVAICDQTREVVAFFEKPLPRVPY